MAAEVAPTPTTAPPAYGDDDGYGYDCASNRAPEPLAANELGLEPIADLGVKPRWFTPDAVRSSADGAYAATSCSPGVEGRAAIAIRNACEWWEKNARRNMAPGRRYSGRGGKRDRKTKCRVGGVFAIDCPGGVGRRCI